MITELIVVWLLALPTWLLSKLPEDEVPGFPDGEGVSAWFAGPLGALEPVLPISEFVDVVGVSLTVVGPAVLTVKLVIWIWFMLPVIK